MSSSCQRLSSYPAPIILGDPPAITSAFRKPPVRPTATVGNTSPLPSPSTFVLARKPGKCAPWRMVAQAARAVNFVWCIKNCGKLTENIQRCVLGKLTNHVHIYKCYTLPYQCVSRHTTLYYVECVFDTSLGKFFFSKAPKGSVVMIILIKYQNHHPLVGWSDPFSGG